MKLRPRDEWQKWRQIYDKCDSDLSYLSIATYMHCVKFIVSDVQHNGSKSLYKVAFSLFHTLDLIQASKGDIFFLKDMKSYLNFTVFFGTIA